MDRDSSPMHLLLQRLGEDDGASYARGHLDFRTNDLAAEVERVV